MTRIALLGEGPLPDATSRGSAFAQLRFSQFAVGLGLAHEVHPVDITRDDLADALRTIRPDAIVSAGTYGPTRAAVTHAGELPLCVDLPGDPFADAQMVAAFDAPAFDAPAFNAVDRVADDARAVFVPALLRADAFTTIGAPSRFSLLGSLGALGRLVPTPPGDEWAFVAPVAWHFPGLDEQPRRPHAAGDTLAPRVALVGGFNTWFDADTLLAGLLRAMDAGPLTVACVGGPIPGHHTRSADQFRAAALASRHAARFRFDARLPPAALRDVLATCTVGVVLDRPGYEPELGSRTRMLLYLHQGLPIVGTARCALAQDLAVGGWLRAVPPADPAALADALLRPFGPLPDRAPLRARFSVAETTRGLRAWAAAPRRRPAPAEATPLAALARERDALRAEIAAIRASPTWRALDRLHRLGPTATLLRKWRGGA